LIQQEDTIQLKKNGNKSGFFNNIEECHAVDYTFLLQTTSPVVFKLIGNHLLRHNWMVSFIMDLHKQKVMMTFTTVLVRSLSLIA
jgi:hypothetical protein